MRAGMMFALLALLATGCASYRPRPAALSQADVISMTQAGVADEEIIRRIDETRTVFRLGAEDVIRLRREGVSERVVNYMLETYVRYVAYLQRRQDFYDFDWHYRFGFWYGPGFYHQHWRRW